MRPGDDVAGVFACTRKDRLTARTGAPYLAVELRDSTGAVEGRVFRDADRFAGAFDRGDLVRVAGRVERFRDVLQLEVRAIARAQPGEADPAAFLPATLRDLDELDGFLDALAGEVRHPAFRALLDATVDEQTIREALRRSPATRSGHHAYLGGLLEHTVGVAQLCLTTCELHPKLDQDLLLTAALVHDLGRTRELALGAEIGLTDEGRLLGHVELGLRLLAERAAACGMDEARHLQVAHCVLTHHPSDGRRPATAEAVALARANALDATVREALTAS
jgi:3'-5' exoribonuclease